MTAAYVPGETCTAHPDHYMPCSKCAGADCCPVPDTAATDLGHLARRFVSLTVTRQHAILDELVGPLAWDDTATFQQRIDLMRQVKERGLVGRLAEMVDTR